MEIASILWVTTDLLLALILLRAARTGLWKTYPGFYIYICYLLLVSGVRHVALWSLARKSLAYYYIYYIPTLVIPLFHVWILWNLYCRIIGYNKNYSGHPRGLVTRTGMLTMPLIVGAAVMGGADVFKMFHVLTLFVEMAFCVQVCGAVIGMSKEVALGSNLKGLLCGLSAMVGLQALNFVGSVFYHSPTPVFSFSVQFIYLLTLIIFFYSLWDESPVTQIDSSLSYRVRQARDTLYQASKSVLLDRK